MAVLPTKWALLLNPPDCVIVSLNVELTTSTPGVDETDTYCSAAEVSALTELKVL